MALVTEKNRKNGMFTVKHNIRTNAFFIKRRISEDHKLGVYINYEIM